jgi:dihydroxyacetone kinase
MTNIGGAMGPLYGTFFREMAKVCEGKDAIDSHVLARMLKAGEAGIKRIGKAKVGDKTLLDSLVPAVEAVKSQVAEEKSFKEALDAMKEAAIEGRDSTKNMVAKVGRASRMGGRSKGVLDPGATSMCLLLVSMVDSINETLG